MVRHVFCLLKASFSTSPSTTRANFMSSTHVLNSGSCQQHSHGNPVTLHTDSTQHYDPVSWEWPDVRVHHSHSTNSTMSSLLSPNMPPHLAAEYIHHPPSTHHPYFLPAHSHPLSPLLSCQWIQEDTHRICEWKGARQALKAHFKTHIIPGPPRAKYNAGGMACSYTKRSKPLVRSMRRDCMYRHVSEIHLRMKRVT
ncbi:uncharacterized protein BJ212DRAFT_1332024 [Suillus subaureus]|uniref:Uncharacterized protein n=1 Tax=Suillus subaureus TaxID=48587 RepID=A0A9P7EHE3_9AGAM|nr:uncharacterized protein BJ212DRAFT_1332024 [Suillus subaureus]KAG1821564.1 hypothetical protein BJ212DRAFT_1332024 [Suillus subaureus]